MNNITFIIFGITGDLAKRKLFSALCQLQEQKKLTNFLVVGIARDSSFSLVPDALKSHFVYYQLNAMQESEYAELSQFITHKEKALSLPGNRLVHLAVPSTLFCPITEYMVKHGVVKRNVTNGIWHRVMYEKPFGWDRNSAQEINKCITHCLPEEQIYRVDHYVTKELVNKIADIKSTTNGTLLKPTGSRARMDSSFNSAFASLRMTESTSPLILSEHSESKEGFERFQSQIDHVQIILTETLGVQGRGPYFDRYGVLKDVVQNHMMQMLVLMVQKLSNANKSTILQKTKCIDGILGQYAGYKDEPGVAPDSQTPTFAALKLLIDMPALQTVPFFLKTGKALDKKNTSIFIRYKNSEDDIILTFDSAHSYEFLYQQVAAGDCAVSVSFDEIQRAWQIIEGVEQLKLPIVRYAQHSSGPEELKTLSKKWHIIWNT